MLTREKISKHALALKYLVHLSVSLSLSLSLSLTCDVMFRYVQWTNILCTCTCIYCIQVIFAGFCVLSNSEWLTCTCTCACMWYFLRARFSVYFCIHSFLFVPGINPVMAFWLKEPKSSKWVLMCPLVTLTQLTPGH